MIKRFTLLFSGILALCASAQNETEQQQKWRESLGSEDFKTRKATMGEIWKEGREALGFLESLADDDNPELAARAQTILRKVRLGVTPETPANIVKLIEAYFNARVGKKIDTIDKLLAAEEYDVLLQLRHLEEEDEVLKRIDITIANFLPKIVRNYLNEGNVELAKEYLLLSGTFDHLIQYAHLLDQTGELDAEIARLSQSKSKKEQGRYLVCLRVKGDAEMLRAAAVKMGDQDAEILAELNLGNHIPYLQSLLKTRNLTLTNQYFVDWSLANHQGKVGLQRKIEKELTALSRQKSERDAARMSLLRMGLGDLVLEGLGESELTDRVEYLLSHENYVQAQKVLGIPAQDGLEEWLAERSLLASEELKKSPTKSLELDRLVLAVRFLEDRGLQEAALKCSRVLFDLVNSSEELALSNFVRRISFPAPVCAYHEIAREVEKDRANLKKFDSVFVMDSASGEWLYGQLEKLYPKKSVLDRLLLMASFSARRLFVPLEEFEATRDALIHSAEVKEGAQGDELTKILVILLSRNREADLKTALGALKRIGKENVFLAMAIEVDAGRIQSGGALYENFETPLNSSSAEFLYQKGLVLKRGGFKGGEELMKKALFLSNGREESLHDFAMSHLRLGEIDEAYKILRKALLRTSATSRMRNGLISELATEAGVLHQWKEADAFPFSNPTCSGSLSDGEK